jgi:hypothetical protein
MAPLLILAALAASAPAIDSQRVCRSELSGIPQAEQPDVYKDCLRDEQAAHDELNKDWTKFPGAVQRTCSELGRLTGSYVEVLTCIEIRTGKLSSTWDALPEPAPSQSAPVQPAAPNATGKP